MSVIVIKNYSEHIRQHTAKYLLDKVLNCGEMPAEAKQAFVDAWSKWEQGQEFREPLLGADSPERVWDNCLEIMGKPVRKLAAPVMPKQSRPNTRW